MIGYLRKLAAQAIETEWRDLLDRHESLRREVQALRLEVNGLKELLKRLNPPPTKPER